MRNDRNSERAIRVRPADLSEEVVGCGHKGDVFGCVRHGVKRVGEYDNADVNNVHHKEKDLGGLLIRFRSADEITAENTTHESTHVAIEIFDYIEARIDTNNQEPFAYLCGWVAGCIEEVKQKLTENGEH